MPQITPARELNAEAEFFASALPAVFIPHQIQRDAAIRRFQLAIDRKRQEILKGRGRPGILLPREIQPPLEQEIPDYPKPHMRFRSFHIDWNDLASFRGITPEKLRQAAEELDISEGTLKWFREHYLPGLYKVTRRFYLPRTASDEQWEALNYIEECARRNKLAAGDKARELLLGFLDDQQREEYETLGRFHIVKMGPIEGYWQLPRSKRNLFGKADDPRLLRFRRYRLMRGFPAGNVQIVRHDGQPSYTLCLHPPDVYPTDDTLLAQKLLIENNEAQAIRDANFTIARDDESVFGVGFESLVA